LLPSPSFRASLFLPPDALAEEQKQDQDQDQDQHTADSSPPPSRPLGRGVGTSLLKTSFASDSGSESQHSASLAASSSSFSSSFSSSPACFPSPYSVSSGPVLRRDYNTRGDIPVVLLNKTFVANHPALMSSDSVSISDSDYGGGRGILSLTSPQRAALQQQRVTGTHNNSPYGGAGGRCSKSANRLEYFRLVLAGRRQLSADQTLLPRCQAVIEDDPVLGLDYDREFEAQIRRSVRVWDRDHSGLPKKQRHGSHNSLSSQTSLSDHDDRLVSSFARSPNSSNHNSAEALSGLVDAAGTPMRKHPSRSRLLRGDRVSEEREENDGGDGDGDDEEGYSLTFDDSLTPTRASRSNARGLSSVDESDLPPGVQGDSPATLTRQARSNARGASMMDEASLLSAYGLGGERDDSEDEEDEEASFRNTAGAGAGAGAVSSELSLSFSSEPASGGIGSTAECPLESSGGVDVDASCGRGDACGQQDSPANLVSTLHATCEHKGPFSQEQEQEQGHEQKHKQGHEPVLLGVGEDNTDLERAEEGCARDLSQSLREASLSGQVVQEQEEEQEEEKQQQEQEQQKQRKDVCEPHATMTISTLPTPVSVSVSPEALVSGSVTSQGREDDATAGTQRQGLVQRSRASAEPVCDFVEELDRKDVVLEQQEADITAETITFPSEVPAVIRVTEDNNDGGGRDGPGDEESVVLDKTNAAHEDIGEVIPKQHERGDNGAKDGNLGVGASCMDHIIDGGNNRALVQISHNENSNNNQKDESHINDDIEHNTAGRKDETGNLDGYISDLNEVDDDDDRSDFLEDSDGSHAERERESSLDSRGSRTPSADSACLTVSRQSCTPDARKSSLSLSRSLSDKEEPYRNTSRESRNSETTSSSQFTVNDRFSCMTDSPGYSATTPPRRNNQTLPHSESLNSEDHFSLRSESGDESDLANQEQGEEQGEGVGEEGMQGMLAASQEEKSGEHLLNIQIDCTPASPSGGGGTGACEYMYTGPVDFEHLSVLDNLERYFKVQVFGHARPSGAAPYMLRPLSSHEGAGGCKEEGGVDGKVGGEGEGEGERERFVSAAARPERVLGIYHEEVIESEHSDQLLPIIRNSIGGSGEKAGGGGGAAARHLIFILTDIHMYVWNNQSINQCTN
jgi:hypothetical protein